MADDANKETDQDVQIDRADLDNMSAKDRKETEEILEDITGKKDGAKPEAKPGEEEKPKPEEKPDDSKDKKPDEKKPEDSKPKDGDQDGNKRREPTLVPAWMLKTAEDQAKKREEKLLADLDAAKTAGKTAEDKGAKPEDVNQAYEKKLESISEKTGIDIEALRELADAFKPASQESFKLPPEVDEKLKKLDAITLEREIAVEEAKFAEDFSRVVLPLIKKEYGDDVPPETISKLKEDLKKVAYSPEYAKVPYETIYKGSDEFRGVLPPKFKAGEQSRGGTVQLSDADKAAKGGDVDFDKLKTDPNYDLSDDEVRKLSDTDFDKYGEAMRVREKMLKGSN